MNRRQRLVLLRTLLFLFLLNLISLAFYFLLHPRPPDPPQTQTLTLTIPQRQTLKPWPPLPSFLPWRRSPAPPLRSCEAYFGHGFSRLRDLVGPPPAAAGAGAGWFRCSYSETLRSSICEGGRVRMDPERIRMAPGGEKLEEVMGRGEEEELPRFEEGAFLVEAPEGGGGGEGEGKGEGGGGGGGSSWGRRVFDRVVLDEYLPQGAVSYHSMRALMESMRIVGRGELECSQVRWA